MAAVVHRLSTRTLFDQLDSRSKLLIHHLSKAAWAGSRIIMRQTSPESIDIFEFIIELHNSCEGDWNALAREKQVSQEDTSAFLEYASRFLSNLGNYFGSGNQKFIPAAPMDQVKRLASGSPRAEQLWQHIAKDVYSKPPFSLGFPSDITQSAYYPASEALNPQDNSALSTALIKTNTWPENLRLQKLRGLDRSKIKVLQASVEATYERRIIHSDSYCDVELSSGDHSDDLARVSAHLQLAADCCESNSQRGLIEMMISSFKSGDLNQYRDSLQLWVKDNSPPIDFVFGFVEPYRDPAGVKAEFEGIVGIFDFDMNKQTEELVSKSDKILRLLPWVSKSPNSSDNGPFEKATFTSPSLICMHTIAYCSSIIFPGINLPNYNDIRESHGHKSLIIANRMQAEAEQTHSSIFIPESELDFFQRHCYETYYIYVLLHELFGHPTGRMVTEDTLQTGVHKDRVPLSPLTNKPITSWYRRGDSWTTVFGDIATTVDECRCELVAVVLMADEQVLSSFGCGKPGHAAAEAILYNLYQQLGCDGLRSLSDYEIASESWGSAHSQGHFAMLQWLLRHGDGVIKVECVEEASRLLVHVDRSKISTSGTAAVRRMLLHLHTYRCTADIASCRTFYEALSRVKDESLTWHGIVNRIPSSKKVFVQENTVLEQDQVFLKEYPTTNEGVIQSWIDRGLANPKPEVTWKEPAG